MSKALAKKNKQDSQIVATQSVQSLTAIEMVSNAITSGTDVTNIDKLIELIKFNDEREATKSFNAAFTLAQAEFPSIDKSGHVNFTNKSTGVVTDYRHSTYNNIVMGTRSVMHKHGLSFRHDIKENITDAGMLISVTVRCILAHKDGHSESAQLTANPDKSGGKNDIQGVGSSVTYLKRYTLAAVTGISDSEHDDDGTETVKDQKEATADYSDFKDHMDAVKRNLCAIFEIKESMERKDLTTAYGIFQELDMDDKDLLWRAPTKGSIWTTDERGIMKSNEWSAARTEYHKNDKGE